jgi:hypothetical protein
MKISRPLRSQTSTASTLEVSSNSCLYSRLSYHVVQHSTMSTVLNFDIIALIIDIVGENKDTNLLKELALVSHSFLQICSKHLFATVDLHIASSKERFLKLLKSRPDVVNYIRKLTYKVNYPTRPSFNNDDHLLLPILRRIPLLNCLKINASHSDWNILDSSLTSALLHLMHLPTVNHIDLSSINNFPLSSLTQSVNLHRLDIYQLRADGSPEIVVLSKMMPQIREFHTLYSPLSTKLLHAKTQDGRPAFNFMDLRRLSINFYYPEDEQNIRYLLQNAKLLEELHLSESVPHYQNLVMLLPPSARTLKVLSLTVFLHSVHQWIYEELEAMAGHNMLEALSFEVRVGGLGTEGSIGSIIQNVATVLVKPGWFALRQVYFKVLFKRSKVSRMDRAQKVLLEKLQSLPDKYLSHLPKLVAFNFVAKVDI